MAKASKTEIDRSMAYLRETMDRGDTVFGVVRNVSSSGMSRTIDFFVFTNGQPYWLSGAMSRVLGLTMVKRGQGLQVRGAGMDMVFHVVSNLAYKVYGDERALKAQTL